MIRAVKIRLLPTSEQEELFRKSAGVARWSYNQFLRMNEALYENWQLSGEGDKNISAYNFRKFIVKHFKSDVYSWLADVSAQVFNQAVIDADVARKRYFKGITGRPKFKSKHRSKLSFYVRYSSLKRTECGFQGECLGEVKTTKPLPVAEKYSNPRISFDGKYWNLSVGIEVELPEVELTDKVIGVDVGVKNLATVSDGRVFENINKSRRIRRLERRLRREQRKLSRKLLANIERYDSLRRPIWRRPLNECRNIRRQNAKIRLIHKRLTDIRINHTHQATAAIVKNKPSRIVMEDLNIRGMMKNRHLAKAIADQRLYEFKRQMRYKAEYYGIEVVEADRFYPSSKKCSHCDHIKSDLKLSERVYRCSECGTVIDRDLNAAINLANYVP